MQGNTHGNNKCSSVKEFNNKIKTENFEIENLRYSLGEYLAPGTEVGEPYKLVKSGDEYFHVLYLPVNEIGFHASGGKGMKLVLWRSMDGSKSRIIK